MRLTSKKQPVISLFLQNEPFFSTKEWLYISVVLLYCNLSGEWDQDRSTDVNSSVISVIYIIYTSNPTFINQYRRLNSLYIETSSEVFTTLKIYLYDYKLLFMQFL